MQRPTHSIAILLTSLVVGSGCAYGELREVVRVDFAADTQCREVEVWDRELHYYEPGVNKLKVRGCDTMRTYTCPDVGRWVTYGENPCTWVEGDPDIPKLGQGAKQRMQSMDEELDDDTADEENNP